MIDVDLSRLKMRQVNVGGSVGVLDYELIPIRDGIGVGFYVEKFKFHCYVELYKDHRLRAGYGENPPGKGSLCIESGDITWRSLPWTGPRRHIVECVIRDVFLGSNKPPLYWDMLSVEEAWDMAKDLRISAMRRTEKAGPTLKISSNRKKLNNLRRKVKRR